MSQKKPFIAIHTDLSPDSIFGMRMLATKYRFHHCVVGEGDVNAKCWRTSKYIEMLNEEGFDVGDPWIVKGKGSDVIYEGEGREFRNYELPREEFNNHTLFMEAFNDFVDQHDGNHDLTIAIMKPPHELLKHGIEISPYMQKIKVYMHFEVNVRMAIRDCDDDKKNYIAKTFTDVIQSCSSLHVHDFVRATLDVRNGIRGINLKKLYFDKSVKSDYIYALLKSIFFKNDHLLKTVYKNARTEKAIMRVETLKSNIDFIIDPWNIITCLLCLNDEKFLPHAKNVDFVLNGEGKFSYNRNKDSPVHLYEYIPFANVLKELETIFV